MQQHFIDTSSLENKYNPKNSLYIRPGVTLNNSTSCPHSVFMCCVWISEQTTIISLYNINWLVFITETECVYCAVRTGYLYIVQVMCFVWIWEQTAIISLCSINWLVFITETECVYCAVRTGYLYIVQVMCFVWIWEQTAIISLYNINWLVFITETECVYCAVRTGYLNIIYRNSDHFLQQEWRTLAPVQSDIGAKWHRLINQLALGDYKLAYIKVWNLVIPQQITYNFIAKYIYSVNLCVHCE